MEGEILTREIMRSRHRWAARMIANIQKRVNRTGYDKYVVSNEDFFEIGHRKVCLHSVALN